MPAILLRTEGQGGPGREEVSTPSHAGRRSNPELGSEKESEGGDSTIGSNRESGWDPSPGSGSRPSNDGRNPGDWQASLPALHLKDPLSAHGRERRPRPGC